jgi:hypothetical protein
MVSNDEPPEKDKLRLVAENDPARIAERQRQAAATVAQDSTAASLAKLIANLLRVLAGGGESYSVPGDLLKTAECLDDAYKAGHRGFMPGLDELTLYKLFEEEPARPQTEKEWRGWATHDPRRDYDEERHFLLQQLRCHVLREIASTITGSDLQIRREKREIDDLLRRFEDARKQYLNGPRRPPSSYRLSIAESEIQKLRATDSELRRAAKSEPAKVPKQKTDSNARQEIADREIANLQAQKCDEMIVGLRPLQWAALRAVYSGEDDTFDTIDSFTFDVLARMELLKRKPGGGKTKRGWQLTQLGTLAMSRAPNS